MLDNLTNFDDSAPSARLLRTAVWLCILGATTVFWVAVGVLVFFLMA